MGPASSRTCAVAAGVDARQRGDLPLSSYAIIGDGLTAALVATDGSVDWFCDERFDAPAVFCRLLDAERGGFLQVAPVNPFRSVRRYVGSTNVLATDFECATGRLRITDCMPLGRKDGPVLLRKVEGLAGEVPVHVLFVPTFDFARATTSIELMPRGCVATASGANLRLSCPGEMTAIAGGATSSFTVCSGEIRWICLTHGTPAPDDASADGAMKATLDAWEHWSAAGRYPGRYADLLRRSALVLKLLIHSPTGAMVAAPTTSLPETPGGVRNWDYRFMWLRDASWVVSALMDLGFHDESMAFIARLESLELASGPTAVCYDLDGRAPGEEHELTHLRGWRSSRPVRIGNAAAVQDQHDVFGEVVSAIHMCSEAMPSMRPLRPRLWDLVAGLADRAAEHWEHADHGMWEVRNRPRHFLSSRLLCWTALDRALAVARRDGLPGRFGVWERERDRIRDALLEENFDQNQGAFTRSNDDRALDASALRLPRYGLLLADDPRMLGTVAQVRQQLSPGKGLVYRYVGPDGLPGAEGAFTACSFWLADCLARQGRLDEAQAVFEQVVAHANELGLLSEEIDPDSGELLGNYPQAFTHLALIRAAVTIAEAEGT